MKSCETCSRGHLNNKCVCIFKGCDECENGFTEPLIECSCVRVRLWKERSSIMGLTREVDNCFSPMVKRYVDHLAGGNLFFHGDVGRGKTYLAHQIIKVWYITNLERRILNARTRRVLCSDCNGKGCEFCEETGTDLEFIRQQSGHIQTKIKYIVCGEMFDELKQNMDDREAPDLIGELGNMELLILDEIGDDKGSEYLTTRFKNLIDLRVRNMKPTIFITNMKLEDINVWEPRIYSRLFENCKFEEMTGQDRRMK